MATIRKFKFEPYGSAAQLSGEIHERTIPRLVGQAIWYGFWGGLLYGAIIQVIIYFASVPLFAPNSNPNHSLMMMLGYVAGMILTLVVTLLAANRGWGLRTRGSRSGAGALLGLIFALTTHSVSTGSFIGLLVNRETFSIAGYPTYSEMMLAKQVYNTVLVGIAGNIAVIALMVLSGALLGVLLLRRAPDDMPVPIARDAFMPLLLSIVPGVMVLTSIINIVVFVLLDESLVEMSGGVYLYDFPAPLALFTGLLPYAVCFVVQIAGIIWLWRVDCANIHRNALNYAQAVYGVPLGILYPLFMAVVQPKFLSHPIGLTLTVLVMGLSIGFVILAQVKMLRYRKHQRPVQLDLSFWKTMDSVQAVTVIGWLLIDLIALRAPYNLTTIIVPLIARSQGKLTAIQAVLDVAYNSAFRGAVYSIGGLLLTLVIVSMLHAPVLACLNCREKRLKY